MNILGIDPGLKGALVLLSDYKPLDVWPMPTCVSYAGDNRVDKAKLLSITESRAIDHAVIEKPMIVRTNLNRQLTMAVNYDIIREVIAMAGIPLYEVSARTWQAYAANVGGGKGKETANKFAEFMNYSPIHRIGRDKRPHDGEIDAFCIASYGYVLFGGLQ